MITFNLYPGAGYSLTPFTVEGATERNLEEGFELLAKKLIEEKESAYFLTVEEFSAMSEEATEEDRANLEEQYLYVDGTCNGAKYPIYIDVLNLSIN